ncbi:hypothetical protein XELAEV_18025624mg [Xenopus laevis]|uniref:Uncharacterized protein n=1 Tax=Xenopus laevis TaxID=8355 RepID=A0A974D2R7_XENLA|nr:hypothetical protein XELAEV_18025624mg [Xenopus laevis]
MEMIYLKRKKKAHIGSIRIKKLGFLFVRAVTDVGACQYMRSTVAHCNHYCGPRFDSSVSTINKFVCSPHYCVDLDKKGA